VIDDTANGALDGIGDAHRRRKTEINKMNGASGNTTHQFMTNLEAGKTFG
jgi:hypothetical protein